MEYTAAEYVDMLIMYGQCGENAVRAAREYNIRFPERRPIAYGVILRLLYRARETANLIPNRRINAVMERRARTVQNEEQILHMVDNAPEMSVREISRELAISRSTVHRVLSDERFHPYHYTQVQHLLPNDYGARLRFCTWLINCENDRPDFARNILFTDESNFTRDGVYNSRNTHLWADENPKEYKIRSFQHRFSVNDVGWCAGQRNRKYTLSFHFLLIILLLLMFSLLILSDRPVRNARANDGSIICAISAK